MVLASLESLLVEWVVADVGYGRVCSLGTGEIMICATVELLVGCEFVHSVESWVRVPLSTGGFELSCEVSCGDSYAYMERLDGRRLTEETASEVVWSGYDHSVTIDYSLWSCAVNGSDVVCSVW